MKVLFTVGEGSEVSSHGIGVVEIASEGQTLAYFLQVITIQTL